MLTTLNKNGNIETTPIGMNNGVEPRPISSHALQPPPQQPLQQPQPLSMPNIEISNLVATIQADTQVGNQPTNQGQDNTIIFNQQQQALQTQLTTFPLLQMMNGGVAVQAGGMYLPINPSLQQNPAVGNLLNPTPFPQTQGTTIANPLLQQGLPPILVNKQNGSASNVIPSNYKNTSTRICSLYMPCDDNCISAYQCLVRKQIELFVAGQDDMDTNSKGRNKPIVLGQVGIRCRHCTSLHPKQRGRGSRYYPAKLDGLYQAAQSMASTHLFTHCKEMPLNIRAELQVLRQKKSSAGGGKKYWGDGARVFGVYEDDNGLGYKKDKK